MLSLCSAKTGKFISLQRALTSVVYCFLCLSFLRRLFPRWSPLPIPNRVVKPWRADGTALLRESRSSPSFYPKKPIPQQDGLSRFYPFQILLLNQNFLYLPAGISPILSFPIFENNLFFVVVLFLLIPCELNAKQWYMRVFAFNNMNFNHLKRSMEERIWKWWGEVIHWEPTEEWSKERLAVGEAWKMACYLAVMRWREKRDAEVWLKAYEDGFAAERKRKKILQKPGKDVHWFPLIAYGQVLWICC